MGIKHAHTLLKGLLTGLKGESPAIEWNLKK